jgi:hypothetical protein
MAPKKKAKKNANPNGDRSSHSSDDDDELVLAPTTQDTVGAARDGHVHARCL